MAIEDLDKPSSPSIIKFANDRAEKHFPPSTDGAEDEPLVNEFEPFARANGAVRDSKEHRSVHSDPVSTEPPAPAQASSRDASARYTPRQAAGDRLAALQEFLQRIEELDQAN